jgi:hypothetical protein
MDVVARLEVYLHVVVFWVAGFRHGEAVMVEGSVFLDKQRISGRKD